MKRNTIIGLLAILALPLAAAESKDTVVAAAKKLGDQSYSWKTTVTVPEGGTRFRPGPTEGKIQKDGTTHVIASFGETKMQTVIKGSKAAVTNRDGEWQSTAELENAEGAGRFSAMMARNFKAPAVQAEEVAGFLKDLKKDGEVLTGALTDEGVKSLLTFRFRQNAEPRPVANPSGTAKFWIKDGVLSKYEFQVKGTMKNQNDEDVAVDRTTTVEIKDVGTTKVEIPAEALKKVS